jgi:hypothetical protein
VSSRTSCLLAAALLVACGNDRGQSAITDAAVRDSRPPVDARAGLCAGNYDAPDDVPVAEPALIEVSGLVASHQNPGVLWAHNDSGDAPRVFALGTDGAALGQLVLTGAPLRDLEDIALGPCPDGAGACLWLADLGNNAKGRGDLAVYAVREPTVSAAAPLGKQGSPYWRFPVSYPAGVTIDVEAAVVGESPPRLTIYEKVDGPTARIFRAALPSTDGATIAFAQAGSLASPGVAVKYGRMITGADLHPSGTRVALRTYTGVFEYRLEAGGTPADLDAASKETVVLGPLSEGQGEAIAYDASGTALWTMSEDPDGDVTQPLHFYGCQR